MKHTSTAQKIIDTIKQNRISTTEVADALGKRYVMQRLQPITHDLHCVGIVRPVFTAYDSNFWVHDQVRAVRPDEVVVVYPYRCESRAILGDLVAKYVTLYRRAAAVAVDGLVRDAARLRRERYPIWATGVTPLGCYNIKGKQFPKKQEKKIRAEVEGGIAVCDDGGVVVIPAAEVTVSTLENLSRIELQEDIWYYCLNVLKWDTKKIVVDRDYLKTPSLLPKAYIKAVKTLNHRLDNKNQK